MGYRLRAAALGGVAALSVCCGAAAQTIDYGALEQLFGEPVTTSATGKPQRASDAPVNMEIITADEIRRTGATNLPDILQRVVGTDVNRWSMGSADVAMRGYASPRYPRLLVLVNGRQVYADHLGYTPWYVIPVELAEIRQIEVVKGPSTALFGFNAVAGVVNIVTYSPLHDDVNNVTMRAGTQGYKELSAVGTVKLGDRGGVRVSGGGFNADDFETPVRAVEQPGRYDPRRRSFSADAQYKLTDDITVGAEFTKIHAQMAEMSFGYNLLGTNWDVLSTKLSASANTGIGLLQANLYRNQLDMNLSNGIEYNNVVIVGQLQDLFKIGTAHSFRLSAEFRRNELDTTPLHNGKVAYNVYSAGGMWDWAINDKLSLVNAGRVDYLTMEREGSFVGPSPYTNSDYNSRTLTEYSFNSGLVYKASDVDTFRLSAARGIQAPNMFEISILQQVGTGYNYGNPYISPSVVMNYEVGYDRRIDAIDGGLRTALYYQTNSDLKNYNTRISPLNQTSVSTYLNIGDSKIVGLEAQLKGRFETAWNWKLGYAYERVSDDLVNQVNYNFEDSTPRHKVWGELGYTMGPWEANLFGQYVSEVKMLRQGTTGLVNVPDYFYLGTRLGYKVTDNVQVSLTGLNVTQAESRQTSGPAEERRLFMTLSVNF